MEVKILNGRETSEAIRKEIAQEVEELKREDILPYLGVILVGDYPPSLIYVRNKEKACEKVGIKSKTMHLPERTSQDELLSLIDLWNGDPEIHGILVQLPLPPHISQDMVLSKISPEKDVDGLTPVNLGRLLSSKPIFYPCTPSGIIELLERNKIEIEGKYVVIVGRGTLVGKPLACMFLEKTKRGNATVTVCHTKTKDIASFTREADILIAAIGSPKAITQDMVKEGAVVVDVGVNRVDGKLVGDVDFDRVKEKVYAITPVPGGVGPMTVTMLLKNTVKAARRAAMGS